MWKHSLSHWAKLGCNDRRIYRNNNEYVLRAHACQCCKVDDRCDQFEKNLCSQCVCNDEQKAKKSSFSHLIIKLWEQSQSHLSDRTDNITQERIVALVLGDTLITSFHIANTKDELSYDHVNTKSWDALVARDHGPLLHLDGMHTNPIFNSYCWRTRLPSP